MAGGNPQGLGRGRYGSQRGGRTCEACPGPGPGGRGQAGTQLLLGLGYAAGEAAAISGELLPGTLAGCPGRTCPDSQEVDGDLL